MNRCAFFFQGNSLLLPPGSPDSGLLAESPLELARYFSSPDIFEVRPPEPPKGPGDPGGYTCVSVEPAEALPEGWRAVAVRQVLITHSKDEKSDFLGKILRAVHISNWRRESVFCGSCGAKNGDSPTENVRLCPACARSEYPRISPAIIVIVTNDKNEVLLAHNKNFQPGLYSLIAGFNEPGENLETTVAREIKEETNADVDTVRYVKSQPWPLPSSLMIGFRASYAGGELRPDGVEIEDARWFKKDGLPDIPAQGSLSRYLIDLWLEGAL